MTKKNMFTSEDQPNHITRRGRGKNKRTLIMEALKAEGKEQFFDDPENDGKEFGFDEAEEWFYKVFVEKAMAGVLVGESFLFGELLKRLHPAEKSTLPPIKFAFKAGNTPVQNYNALMEKVGEGDIAPDIGVSLAQAINMGVNIMDVTDLAQKVEEIEKAMKADA